MISSTKNHSGSFYRALATMVIGAPMLLVAATSLLPEGPERGEFMVYCLGAVLLAVVTALALRAAYALGFSKAFKIAATKPNRSVTA